MHIRALLCLARVQGLLCRPFAMCSLAQVLRASSYAGTAYHIQRPNESFFSLLEKSRASAERPVLQLKEAAIALRRHMPQMQQDFLREIVKWLQNVT